MRGKASPQHEFWRYIRITPAYAGKSVEIRSSRPALRDHPRLCGEKFQFDQFVVRIAGSPPPMRGKVPFPEPLMYSNRITPAYAGKSPAGQSKCRSTQDHPRLCGEKFIKSSTVMCHIGSPPPMRGKVDQNVCFDELPRITPAYAGKSNTG